MSKDTPAQDDYTQKGKLLSSQEREAFKMIAIGNDLHGQRATALLAIDEGVTQVEAGLRAGLTVGQVKYWLGKFRQVRMNIFPGQVLLPEDMDTGEVVPASKQKSAKKSRKSQDKKDEKKGAKKKKAKKGKKPPKKSGKKKKQGAKKKK